MIHPHNHASLSLAELWLLSHSRARFENSHKVIAKFSHLIHAKKNCVIFSTLLPTTSETSITKKPNKMSRRRQFFISEKKLRGENTQQQWKFSVKTLWHECGTREILFWISHVAVRWIANSVVQNKSIKFAAFNHFHVSPIKLAR